METSDGLKVGQLRGDEEEEAGEEEEEIRKEVREIQKEIAGRKEAGRFPVFSQEVIDRVNALKARVLQSTAPAKPGLIDIVFDLLPRPSWMER